MNKNDLIQEFNKCCMGLAAYMDEHMEQQFPEDETAVTIPFIDTQMSDIDDIWWDEDNLLNARNYFDSLPSGSRIAIATMAVEMIEQNRHHLKQLEDIKLHTGSTELIYYMPHVANYASDIQDTNGYEALSSVFETIDDVSLLPWLVTNPETDNLKSAFMLGVHIQSIDAEPLRNKIQRATNAGLFDAIRTHYGLN